MSKGFERVRGFIEIGAVALEARTLVSEVNLTVEDGGVGIQALVVVKHVGMNQIDTSVLSPGLADRTFALLLGTGLCQTENRNQKENYVF